MSDYPRPDRLSVLEDAGHFALPRGPGGQLVQALRDYRQVHKAYHDALPTPEQGNVRQREAIEAQRQAIADGVNKGMSAEQIYRLAGPVDFMPNHFAREVVSAYEDLLRRKLAILTAVLAAHREAVEAWLESADTAEAQAALSTLQSLLVNA